MKINSINVFNNVQKTQNYKFNTYTINQNNTNFLGTPRVDKGMTRFYEFNLSRFPQTVIDFLNSVADKFKFTPLEAQKSAFFALNQAKNIKEVQNLFPNENLFKDLKNIQDTKAAIGLLAIYREFKDLYENGILKNEEDLSVYLLKKIFLDAKTLDEINADMDKDLNEDIKNEFKRRYPTSDYILSSTLKSLGIIRPDTAYQNSLKFTREGYSDEFGVKISQGQLKYWNSLTDEQKFEILSKRCEGRDNWWNSLSYDEKLELAAGVDSDDDLYKNYKRFVRASKKDIAEGKSELNLERPTKKIKIGNSNLKDKDIFNLWFRKNLEKFYSRLSEADKDSVHIKRARKLAVRWQEMTPEERTELINKMREGREPLRYAMIDTWNHSRVLIRELSEFLSAQQILKPVDLLYSSEEFSEFQSKIMTEFWANHRDLAEEFGKKLQQAILRVELSIQRGQFEDLKQEILRDRAYRIKLLNREKAIEEQKIEETAAKKVAEEKKDKTADNISDYKEEFRKEYKLYYNKGKYLPDSYVEEIIDMMLHTYPQNIIEQMTKTYQSGSKFSDELLNEIQEKGSKDKIPASLLRSTRAIEAAISCELYAKDGTPAFFASGADSLIGAYKKRMSENLPNKKYPDAQRIQRLYNEYKKDLTNEEICNITDRFFIAKDIEGNKPENNEKLINYIKSYGRSALILFSDKSAFSDEVKIQFNNKFLKYMPKELKELYLPLFNDSEDIIREKQIQQIRGQIARRFDFMPEDLLNTYTQEAAFVIRLQEKTNAFDNDAYSVKSFKEKMCTKRTGTNLEGTCLKIPKYMSTAENKIKLLSAEQALADELYRVTKNEKLYYLELEDLCNIFELFSKMKGNKNLEIIDASNDISLLAKTKPNKNNVFIKYKEYVNELKDRAEDIFDGNNIKDKEELLFALNPITDNPERDANIKQRIKAYLS